VPCGLVLAILTTYDLSEPFLCEMEMNHTQGYATRGGNCAQEIVVLLFHRSPVPRIPGRLPYTDFNIKLGLGLCWNRGLPLGLPFLKDGDARFWDKLRGKTVKKQNKKYSRTCRRGPTRKMATHWANIQICKIWKFHRQYRFYISEGWG